MLLNPFDLAGKAALVTGAARGLGRGMAEGLAAAGADIALVDRLPCDEAAAAIGALGRRAIGVNADLSGLDAARADALVDTVAEAMDRLDILVHAAGFIHRAPALEYADADWAAVLDIHLTGAFALAQAAARRWTARGEPGKIVLVASMLSYFGGRNAVAYAAAKSGLVGLVRALAVECAPRGINVNALAPGWFATELTAGLRADSERAAGVQARIPAGRWGEPADLAGAVVFLASPASDYVHGAILPVDGGYLAA